jgi:2'-5' RNA ligase
MQAALAAATEYAVLAAQAADGGVRRVPPANFHLTLAFLGSVPVSRLAEVKEVAAQCARLPNPSELPIDLVLDCIERWRRPQVIVACASETPPAAVALAEALKRSLIAQGFAPDLKPFRAHATVARKVRRVTRELPFEPVRWTFDSLHLIESKTSPAGSTYSTHEKWVLDKRD